MDVTCLGVGRGLSVADLDGLVDRKYGLGPLERWEHVYEFLKRESGLTEPGLSQEQYAERHRRIMVVIEGRRGMLED